MNEKKKVEVIFAPGCFDNFEGTQEELDEMMADIHRMIESGELFEKSVPLSEETLQEMDPEDVEQLANALGFVNDEETTERKLH